MRTSKTSALLFLLAAAVAFAAALPSFSAASAQGLRAQASSDRVASFCTKQAASVTTTGGARSEEHTSEHQSHAT